jgi:bacteriocin biosynthesis cyclodehydratase domain-containing protein
MSATMVSSLRSSLRAGTELFEASDGALYLLRSDGGGDVVIRGATEPERHAVRWLAGREQRAPSPSAFKSAQEALGDWVQAGQTAGPAMLSDEQLTRFDRQLAYFHEARGDRSSAVRCQARLASASVTIIGLGGLGSWALAGLACSGVGTFVLVDDDTVDLSNLNRQFLYKPADLGTLKVDAAAAYVRGFNADATVVTAAERMRSTDDVRSVIAGSDVVIDTADWPAYEIARWVNGACLQLGIAHICAGQFPPLVRIGPTYIPGQTPCHGCMEEQVRDSFAFYDELVASRQRWPTPAPTLGPASALIGAIIAMEVTHVLTGISPPATAGRALTIDLRTMQQDWEPVARHPRCACCPAAASGVAATPGVWSDS